MVRITREQSRRVDQLAADKYHMPGVVLMENAARSAAEVCDGLVVSRPGAGVIIVCGHGNNGGDGLALARHLHNRGMRVKIAKASDPIDGSQYVGEALVNWNIVKAMGLPVVKLAPGTLVEPDVNLVVDAVFGTGLSSPPRAWFEAVAGAINQSRESGRKVLAIDVPSGLDCDTGKPLGACVRATTTVTFVAEKVGFALSGAREFLGEVVVGDIGIPNELLREVV
jgi:NAD(P)H-hydrate epimerase